MINKQSNKAQSCPCGSQKPTESCCLEYINEFDARQPLSDSLLISWLDKYSPPIQKSFREKTGPLIFRISLYQDFVFDSFYTLGFPGEISEQEKIDRIFRSVKHNIMLSIFGSMSCLSQGLFIQSGSLIRGCIEDSLVLLDVSKGGKQLSNILANNYSTKDVLKRTKRWIPTQFAKWYGNYSANFTHFGPFHCAPYRPSACYADHFVIGFGLDNLLMAAYMFHVIIERVHFTQLANPYFWKTTEEQDLVFNDENKFTRYIEKLRSEIMDEFNPDGKKPDFHYTSDTVRAKT